MLTLNTVTSLSNYLGLTFLSLAALRMTVKNSTNSTNSLSSLNSTTSTTNTCPALDPLSRASLQLGLGSYALNGTLLSIQLFR